MHIENFEENSTLVNCCMCKLHLGFFWQSNAWKEKNWTLLLSNNCYSSSYCYITFNLTETMTQQWVSYQEFQWANPVLKKNWPAWKVKGVLGVQQESSKILCFFGYLEYK